MLSNYKRWQAIQLNGDAPEGFEKGTAGMNFLDPDDSYFHYPWGLYSAGHAHLDTEKSDEREPMVQGRDRSKTMILGDSGGFQLLQVYLKWIGRMLKILMILLEQHFVKRYLNG